LLDAVVSHGFKEFLRSRRASNNSDPLKDIRARWDSHIAFGLKDRPIIHRPRNPDGPFGALVPAIVYQQLAGRAAQAIHGRLRTTVGQGADPRRSSQQPTRHSAPPICPRASSPPCAISPQRSSTERSSFTKASRRSDEDLVAGLVSVRGSGGWSAEMYLMFQLRRLDVWPVDDRGVRQGYAPRVATRTSPTPKQLEPLGDYFRALARQLPPCREAACPPNSPR
jgi:DNA-3-methyladenine glycosylase II